MRRRSIEVPGLGHGDRPIPQASVVDGLLISGGINGMDPKTGTIADTLEEQLSLVFANIRAILTQAGGTTDDIVKVTVFARDRHLTPSLDVHWREMFPDREALPARHLVIADLPPALSVQAEIVAVMERPFK